jgi:hypothetical protein
MATKSIARTGSWQRLVGRGKPPKLALTACIGKLLVILNAALRDRRPSREPGMPRRRSDFRAGSDDRPERRAAE